MATRIFAVSPGQTVENVIDTVGPTATSAIVALVIDLSASITGAGGVARAPNKSEILQAVNELKQKITKSTNV